MDVEKLAEDHVDWILDLVKPLMVAEFIHGYKHGFQDAENGNPTTEVPKFYNSLSARARRK